MTKKILLAICAMASTSAIFAANQTESDSFTLEGVKQLSDVQMKNITGENMYKVLVYADGSYSPWILVSEIGGDVVDVVTYVDADTGEFIKMERIDHIIH